MDKLIALRRINYLNMNILESVLKINLKKKYQKSIQLLQAILFLKQTMYLSTTLVFLCLFSSLLINWLTDKKEIYMSNLIKREHHLRSEFSFMFLKWGVSHLGWGSIGGLTEGGMVHKFCNISETKTKYVKICFVYTQGSHKKMVKDGTLSQSQSRDTLCDFLLLFWTLLIMKWISIKKIEEKNPFINWSDTQNIFTL